MSQKRNTQVRRMLANTDRSIFSSRNILGNDAKCLRERKRGTVETKIERSQGAMSGNYSTELVPSDTLQCASVTI